MIKANISMPLPPLRQAMRLRFGAGRRKRGRHDALAHEVPVRIPVALGRAMGQAVGISHFASKACTSQQSKRS